MNPTRIRELAAAIVMFALIVGAFFLGKAAEHAGYIVSREKMIAHELQRLNALAKERRYDELTRRLEQIAHNSKAAALDDKPRDQGHNKDNTEQGL